MPQPLQHYEEENLSLVYRGKYFDVGYMSSDKTYWIKALQGYGYFGSTEVLKELDVIKQMLEIKRD